MSSVQTRQGGDNVGVASATGTDIVGTDGMRNRADRVGNIGSGSSSSVSGGSVGGVSSLQESEGSSCGIAEQAGHVVRESQTRGIVAHVGVSADDATVSIVSGARESSLAVVDQSNSGGISWFTVKQVLDTLSGKRARRLNRSSSAVAVSTVGQTVRQRRSQSAVSVSSGQQAFHLVCLSSNQTAVDHIQRSDTIGNVGIVLQ